MLHWKKLTQGAYANLNCWEMVVDENSNLSFYLSLTDIDMTIYIGFNTTNYRHVGYCGRNNNSDEELRNRALKSMEGYLSDMIPKFRDFFNYCERQGI